jgi:hypothetical protein
MWNDEDTFFCTKLSQVRDQVSTVYNCAKVLVIYVACGERKRILLDRCKRHAMLWKMKST